MTLEIESIPKAEIHCHIEGAAHPDFVRKQADKYGKDLNHIFSDDGETYRWHDFTSFIEAYAAVSNVLMEPEDYIALTQDVLLRQASQNVIYQEFFCSPDNSDRMHCSYITMIEAMAEGARLAKETAGIECRFITTGVRNIGMHHVDEAAALANAHPHPMVTGFGMAGDERMGDVREVVNAFEMAKDAGLRLTAHAGELCDAQSVRDCLDHLNVERIGHGVRCVEDPELVRRLAEQDITLEVCPGSNIALNVFEEKDHPLGQLRDAGVKVTLSSDDPPFFRTTTTHEYALAHQTYGFDRAALLQTTRTSLEAAFVDEDTRASLIKRFEVMASGLD